MMSLQLKRHPLSNRLYHDAHSTDTFQNARRTIHCSAGVLLNLSQKLLHSLGGCALHFGDYMGIGVHGDLDAGMSKHGGNNFSGDSALKQHSGAGVSEIVESDIRQVKADDSIFKLMLQCTGCIRNPRLPEADQIQSIILNAPLPTFLPLEISSLFQN